jgi:hypothetical protein
MDGDTHSEDPSKNGSGDPGLVAPSDLRAVVASLSEALPPAIPAPMVPCGMPPIPNTSVVDATTGRQWATGTNKVWFLSSTQRFLQSPGIQNTKTDIGAMRVPRRRW